MCMLCVFTNHNTHMHRGKYADIPFVSDAVYIQVDASEYA